MEMKNEREMKHKFHKHPLVFVEEQCNEGYRKAYCCGCREVVSGPFFTCSLCNYHLHQKCAEAPLSISNHPLHPKHNSGFFLRERPFLNSECVYGCALCKEKHDMFFYECNTCYFSLDIKCFNLSSSYSEVNQESKHDFHRHPLTFIQTPMDPFKRFSCLWCHQPLLDAIYFCFSCPSFVFHKKCFDELPAKISHPSHRQHLLSLEREKDSLICKPCQKQHSGYFYSCSLCNFNISIECAWPRPIVEDKSHHQHAFTLFWRQDAFICDACGIEGNYISYICSSCNFMVHKDCTKLPRIIKFSRHAHCLFHKYSLVTQELARQDCMSCFEEVKVERGSYSCVKPDCNYVVHVNCTLDDSNLYDVIEQEWQCEGLNAATQSSITYVIEENEDGEATKIEHFMHEGHCLVLADKMKEETDRKCDGCMLPVSTDLFYHCSESDCHFCLHKHCSELPRIKPLWLHRSNATLQSEGFLVCDLCTRDCSGFFYKIKGYYNVCLRCADVPDIIERKAHQGFLFFDFKCKKKRCNGCGNNWHNSGAFRCGKSNFALDFRCVTLPDSTRHKSDEHMLYLYHHDDNEYPNHCYCDICEEKRDQSLQYYHCSICDTSAHFDCVLGNFSFVKDGTRLSDYFYNPHYHDLIFLKEIEGYPECSHCGKLCLEEIYKCEESTCNFIIHFKCRFQ